MSKYLFGVFFAFLPLLTQAEPVQYACSNNRFSARLVLDTEDLYFELYASDGTLVAKPDSQNRQRQKTTTDDGNTLYLFGGFDVNTFAIAFYPDGNTKLVAIDNATQKADYRLNCKALARKDDM